MTVEGSFVDLCARDDFVICADNSLVLPELPDASFRLIYIDPPFNTGRGQRRNSITVERVGDSQGGGDRTGFGGRRYRTTQLGSLDYKDSFDDYLEFIAPRLVEAHRLLTADGTLYFHIDYREAHYCKVLLDEIFGRDCFINEIIWAYDYGGRPKRRWPAKHDTIFMYARDPSSYYFDRCAVERIPYMAPELAGAEKAARGKLPTDVWWHTIVSPTGKEKTGYPTQKPEGVIRRIIQASSEPGDWVLDFFAGSGTTGAVARALDRRFVLVDMSADAYEIIENRLGNDRITYRDLRGHRSIGR